MIEKIDQDINTALKGGDRTRADALRYLKSVLMTARIASRGTLSEDEANKIIRKEIKARVEARDIYANNDRSELAAKEEYERSLYATYIPAELSAEEIKSIILESAGELNENPTFAQLMPLAMKKIAGKADGRTVSDEVKSFINGTL